MRKLDNNIKVLDTAHPLARGKQTLKQKNGSERTSDYVVVWTNEVRSEENARVQHYHWA